MRPHDRGGGASTHAAAAGVFIEDEYAMEDSRETSRCLYGLKGD